MVTLTTDNGTFEAETLRQAQRTERKAAKLAKAQSDVDAANYRTAYTRAHSAAYSVIVRVIRGESMPRGWRILPIQTGCWSCEPATLPDGVYSQGWTVRTSGESGGTAVGSFHGSIPRHVLENGSGFAMALLFDPKRAGEGPQFYAVGVCADQIAVAELPGVTVDMFHSHNGVDA